jgi:hypothetical protein
MRGFMNLIWNLLYRYDIEIAELQSILAKVILGVVFLINLPNVDDAGYKAIETSVDYRILSVAVCILGIFHIIGMMGDKVNYRRLASLLSCVIWSYLTVVIGKTHDIFAILSSTFALSSALVYLRLTGILSRSQRRNNVNEGVSTISSVSTERATSLPPGPLD